MVTVLDFIAELLGSVIQLIVIFITQVALRDPLAFISFLIGAGLTTFAIAAFGYLALGALANLFSGSGSGGAPGRTPPPRD